MSAPANASDLMRQLDELCTEALGSDAARRQAATAQLDVFYDVQHLDTIFHMLRASENQATIIFAATILRRIINSKWSLAEMTPSRKINLKIGLLTVIAERGSSFLQSNRSAAPPLKMFITNLVSVAKLGWLEHEELQSLPRDVRTQFMENPDQNLQIIGLMIMRELVSEISTPSSRHRFPQHRRTSAHFKETALQDILACTLGILERVVDGSISSTWIFLLAMNLCNACLTFDFFGGLSDDPMDDTGLTHVPPSWRTILVPVDRNGEATSIPILKLLWDIYAATAQAAPSADLSYDMREVSTLAIKCLVQLTTVKRCIFVSEQERLLWLKCIMTGVTNVLQGVVGLNNPQNFHEMCRLISRLRPFYLLQDMIGVDCYVQFIDAVAKFTCNAFEQWRTTTQSQPLLLSFWMRMITSLPFLRSPHRRDGVDSASLEAHYSTVRQNLRDHCTAVTQQYIKVRLEMAQYFAAKDESSETETAIDPLDNFDQLSVQLDNVPPLVRGCFAVVGPALSMQLELFLTQYQQAILGNMAASEDGRKLEAGITWLTYVAGVVISHGQACGLEGPDGDSIDAQLSASAFQLSYLLEMRAAEGKLLNTPLAKLECSLLHFFTLFRRVFIGATSQSNKIFVEVQAELGKRGALPPGVTFDANFVLSRVVEKLTFNLRRWGGAVREGVPQLIADRVIRETLILLQDLTNPVSSSVRSIHTLPQVRQLLECHSESEFPFLLPPNGELPTRQRSGLLRVLTNILFVESSRVDSFDRFVAPQQTVLSALRAKLAHLDVDAPDPNALLALRQEFAQPGTRGQVVGLVRDLRGLAWACDRKPRYQALCDVVFPFFPTIERLTLVVAPDPTVANLLVKFVGDFAVNRNQRVVFPVSSPNGILLFKHAASVVRILLTYQRDALPTPTSFEVGPDFVPDASTLESRLVEQLRGVKSGLTSLTWALTGNYCCFGVFELYRDPILANVLSVTLECMLKAGTSVFALTKFGVAYFNFLETLCESHMRYFVALPPPQIATFLRFLEAAVMMPSLQKNIVYAAANSIGHIATYVFQNRGTPAGDQLQHILNEYNCSDMWARLMYSLMNSLLFDQSNLQWNVSRTLLPLILLAPTQYQEYQVAVCNMVAPDKRARMEDVRTWGGVSCCCTLHFPSIFLPLSQGAFLSFVCGCAFD